MSILLQQKRVTSGLSFENQKSSNSLLNVLVRRKYHHSFHELKISVSSLLERWIISLFRKMCMSAYINQQQINTKLIKSSKLAFGDDAILVFGDWSVSNAKYHETIRGNVIRKILKKDGGFRVCLLNELKKNIIKPFPQV
ncbi:MAG: hypothetical protein EXX96DRAFT_520601 [Benjaminiella poitrasii]|nr:MAG: hypothetical protein EXX96DRAFT_520601 [Benjaminiella poitrasii]